MTTEERLRAAIREYTETIEPARDGWERIRDRTAARHRRPRWQPAIAAAAAAVVLAIVIAAVAVERNGDDGGNRVTAGPTSAAPQELVAVSEDGRLVVLETSSGRELRTLADGADAQTVIALTPDGERVFFDRPSTFGGGPAPREIATVPIDGGDVRVPLGEAEQPALSPDGTRISWVGYGGPAGGSLPQSLMVATTASILDTPEGLGGLTVVGESNQIVLTSWASDSRHLAFQETERPTTVTVFDTATPGSLAEAGRERTRYTEAGGTLVDLAENVDWAGYLGGTGDFLGAVFPPSYGRGTDMFDVVAIDPDGEVARELFSVTGTLSQPFLADASGRHILLRTGRDSASEALYRWSEGDASASKVADGIVAAAWVPAQPATNPPPSQIAAVTEDGRLVVLVTEDGRELRTLARGVTTAIGESAPVQASRDSATVYFTRDFQGNAPCDGVTEVARADLGTGEIEGIAFGARYPALSPDGQALAFTSNPNSNCATSASITVIDLASGNAKQFTTDLPLGTDGIAHLSWAPDSRHLTYALFTASQGSFPRVIDTQAEAPLDQPERIFNPDGSRIHGYLGDTGQFVGTRAPGGTEPSQDLQIVAFDAASGAIDRTLFRISESCCGQAVVPDSTGGHLLATGAFPPALYRWSEGDVEPTKIADGIVAAAWLPGGAERDANEVEVPDVSGLEANTARRELENAGFVVDVSYRTDGDEFGRVLDQRPAAGTGAASGSEAEIVVDIFEPCGGFLGPAEIPEGFEVRTGPAPEAPPIDPVFSSDLIVVLYTDDNGRSIEIRRPATTSAISFRTTGPPDAYVLGQPILFTPLDPEFGAPLVAQFFLPEPSLDPCTSYSVNGYGVTKEELAAFAESLRPIPSEPIP